MYCGRCGTWVPAGEAACGSCGQPQDAPRPEREREHVVADAREPEVPASAPATRYGGFWRRAAAGFVDSLVLYFPHAILRVLAGLPPSITSERLSEGDMHRSLVISCTMFVVWWWYCARLESSRWQGTLGQQLLDLRVTDREGRRIGFLRASGRFFAQVLSLLLCGLGYLFNLWTPRRQTLHDLVAGCTIVRPARGVSAAAPASFAGQAS